MSEGRKAKSAASIPIQDFGQDILDDKTYNGDRGALLPDGVSGRGQMKDALPRKVSKLRFVEIGKSDHLIPKQRPTKALRLMDALSD
jgi:hypothetical protein